MTAAACKHTRSDEEVRVFFLHPADWQLAPLSAPSVITFRIFLGRCMLGIDLEYLQYSSRNPVFSVFLLLSYMATTASCSSAVHFFLHATRHFLIAQRDPNVISTQITSTASLQILRVRSPVNQ